MANDFANVPFDDEDRIFRPAIVPNTLFNPFLPDVSSLKALVAPLYDGNDAKAHTASLQASMQLNDDTLLFAKLVLMFAEAAAAHLDLTKGYVQQDLDCVVAYVAEVEERFPKLGDYFVDSWPAYSFVNIYLDQIRAREQRRQELDRQAERVRSIVHSVRELLSAASAQPSDVGGLDY